jgi:hypothetical protein
MRLPIRTLLAKLWRDRLVLFTLISVLFWGSWSMLRTPCHPWSDLSCGIYTDHFSHMNTARLFVHEGVGIWTEPLIDAAPQLDAEQLAELPEDMRSTITPDGLTAVSAPPGWPADKPYVSSWGLYPRFHPPGNMLLTAPVAALYSLTGLSFTDANRLLILSFLIYAHIAFYVFVKGGDLASRLKPVGFAVGVLVYFEMIHWSLEGFYEAIVVVPLVLAARFLAQRRGVEALLAFTVATMVHFRALFFAPWALYAIYLVLRERQWRSWRRRHVVQGLLAIILGSACLTLIAVLWPHLHELNIYNPVNVAADPVNAAAIKTLVLAVVVLAGVFVYTRAWLDVFVLVWVAMMLLFMRQTYEWEILSFLAWLGAPIITSRPQRATVVRDVRLVAMLLMAVLVFHSTLVPTWLQIVVA